MPSAVDVVATIITALSVVLLIDCGLLVAQRVLLSVLVALLAYVAWQHFRNSSPDGPARHYRRIRLLPVMSSVGS